MGCVVVNGKICRKYMGGNSCGSFWYYTAGFVWEIRQKPRQISITILMPRPRIESATYRRESS
jgi:hypothetical protein